MFGRFSGWTPPQQVALSARREQDMKYLCLVYLSQDNWSACPDKAGFAFAEQLVASGHMLASSQ